MPKHEGVQCSHVIIQLVLPGKCLRTDIAGITCSWPLVMFIAFADRRMSLQTIHTGKPLLTAVALQLLKPMARHMRSEQVLLHVAFLTDVAHKSVLPRVLQHVLFHSARGYKRPSAFWTQHMGTLFCEAFFRRYNFTETEGIIVSRLLLGKQ